MTKPHSEVKPPTTDAKIAAHAGFSSHSLMSAFRLLALFALATTLSIRAAEPPKPTQADVSYGSHPHQLLDVFVPPDGTGPFPVLVWYGGIWKESKHVPDLNRFFPKHIAVVGVETRTLTDATQD